MLDAKGLELESRGGSDQSDVFALIGAGQNHGSTRRKRPEIAISHGGPRSSEKAMGLLNSVSQVLLVPPPCTMKEPRVGHPMRHLNVVSQEHG